MMTPAGRRQLDALRVSGGLDPDAPWGGRSPRVLTKAYERFTLGLEAPSLMSEDDVLDEQYRRFLYAP